MKIDQVINQKINGTSLENYIAELIEKLDRDEIEKQKTDQQVALLKQLNNRHKNIIDAYRVAAKLNEVGWK